MKKIVFKNFQYTECDDFAVFLRDMAAEGWHFKEWKLGLVFEKGVPSEEEYVVEVFVHGNELDTKPEPKTEEFAEYCEAAGWRLVDAKKKFCIFKKCKETAVSIVTAEERLENITKAAMRNRAERIFTFGMLMVLYWGQFLGWNTMNYVFSNLMLGFMLCVNCMFLYHVIRGIHLYIWNRKRKKKILAGEKIYYGVGNKNQTRKDRLVTTISLVEILVLGGILWYCKEYLLLGVLGVLGVFAAIFIVTIRTFRPSKAIHQFIRFSASILITVFTIVCMMIAIWSDKPLQLETQKSVLGSRVYHEAIYDNPNELDRTYTLYQSEYDWVLDRVWEEMSEYFPKDNICTEEWGAQEALKGDNALYLVRYENKILFLNEHTNLTQEQIQVVRNRLELR